MAAQLTADPMLTVYGPDERQTHARMLGGHIQGFDEDCRRFAEVAQRFRLDRLWRELSPSWAAFCEQYLNHSQEFVDAVIAGVRALGEDVPIPIERAAAEGRRLRQAESKRLVEEEGMSLREAAEVLGCAPSTVLEDTRRPVFDEAAIDEKSNTPTRSQRTAARQVYLPPDAARAAQKIRAKFGAEFAAALARELL